MKRKMNTVIQCSSVKLFYSDRWIVVWRPISWDVRQLFSDNYCACSDKNAITPIGTYAPRDRCLLLDLFHTRVIAIRYKLNEVHVSWKLTYYILLYNINLWRPVSYIFKTLPMKFKSKLFAYASRCASLFSVWNQFNPQSINNNLFFI